MEVQAQIEKAESELCKAMLESDMFLLDLLIHDDLLFVIPDGSVVTKEMDLESYRSGNMKVSDMSVQYADISIIGDSATVIADVEMEGTFMGQMIDGDYRFLRVWKLFGREWKVIGGSSHLVE